MLSPQEEARRRGAHGRYATDTAAARSLRLSRQAYVAWRRTRGLKPLADGRYLDELTDDYYSLALCLAGSYAKAAEILHEMGLPNSPDGLWKYARRRNIDLLVVAGRMNRPFMGRRKAEAGPRLQKNAKRWAQLLRSQDAKHLESPATSLQADVSEIVLTLTRDIPKQVLDLHAALRAKP